MKDSESEVSTTVAQIQAIIKALEKDKDEDKAAQRAETSSELLDKVSGLDGDSDKNRTSSGELQNCAVNLWNIAVAKRAGGHLSTGLNARLRHLACQLAFKVNPLEGSEVVLKRRVMMASKTGRAWLDCGNPSMADNSLSLASECLEKLTKNMLSAAAEGKLSEDDKERLKTEIEKDMFKVFCYQAESAVAQEQHDVAMRLAQRCKEMLARLPKETTFLAMLCYNFGVETYQKQKYEEAVAWLRESFELGKGNGQPATSSKNQARTLRLLASAYLEWDSKQHWQKALNAVGLANSEHSHPAGLHLKVHILLVSDTVEDNRLVSAVTDCLRHPELTVELALNTIKLLIEHKRTQLALDGVKQLTQQFQASPELGKVYLLHLRILLDNRQMQAAKALVEDCITGHNTTQPLDTTTRKRFHLLLWEQAAQAYEANEYEEALRWYDYSRNLFSSNDRHDNNMAKLERNRSACYLHLKQYDKALEAAKQAETCDPTSPHTQYALFKIALLQGNSDAAIEAIEKMGTVDEKGEENSTVEGLVCLAAQLAFEESNRDVAIRALERLVQHSHNIQQVLTAIRCLTRLRLTFTATSEGQRSSNDIILSYLETAHNKLQELKKTKEDGIVNEATWFMKIAWNLGLKCGEDTNMMHQFFNTCFKFSSLCPMDMANLVRKKTCALMAAAACLQSARNVSDPGEKMEMLKKVILHVDACRETCREICNSKITDTDCSGDSTPILLCLYEFEAKAKMGEPDLTQLVDRVMAMPQADAKTLETMAALAQEAPAAQPTISVKALKEAIKRHLQTPNTDFTKCSKAFHSLIQLVLNKGSSSDPNSKEEAWGYYKEAMDVIDNKSQGCYPEMEILWLMTKAWNCGIHLLSAGHYVDAEHWCGMSMKLLKHLTSLRTHYDTQMTAVYGEVLAKIEAQKVRSNKEE
ncbi:testis-expressed protein 11-like [Branchiostoma floridae x Branchiostoma japonicum]